MSRGRRVWRWTQVLAGAALLIALLMRLGAGPFLDGFARVSPLALLAAVAITALTTLCCAVRWRLVARGLHLELSLGTAVAAYYRSQFVNSTLPGGVLGDLDRGVVHGRRSADVSGGLRAVAWERLGGHLVQLVVAAALLIALPSPLRAWMPGVMVVVVLIAGVLVLAAGKPPAEGGSLRARISRRVRADLREGLGSRAAWPGVVLTSVGATAGHLTVFVIAAEAAGVTVSPTRLLPLAAFILVAMSVPTNIAGWGPREGAAAWVFGAAGLGAAQGVTVAVVYGVLALVACLPGAIVLAVDAMRRRGASHAPVAQPDGQPDGQPDTPPTPHSTSREIARG